uniref:BACK domain-containing protein n=1 Tax=Tetradesmus obliquus TaxID=3088 RepID=A0A383WGT3_TETOB|eukprot:jgi/Sobl393_1/2726/SZX76708.1
MIADMMGIDAAAQQAVKALASAAKSEQGLSAAALQALAGLAAWPACLLQLLPTILKRAACCRINSSRLEDIIAADTNKDVQQLLLGAFGDLDAACADKQLKQLLLKLPLPALQLLLSSDNLRVASEDTVLYVAQRHLFLYYVDEVTRAVTNTVKIKMLLMMKAAEMATAQAALAPLVRAPHLSLFALSCAALHGQSTSSSWQPLNPYMSQVRSLLSLKQAATAEQLAAAVAELHTAPASWRLGPRQIVPLADGVRLEWRLPVQQLRQASSNSFTMQGTINIHSPESSPPLGGWAWQMVVECKQAAGGTVVGLFVGPRQQHPDIWYKCNFTATWCGLRQPCRGPVSTVSRGLVNVLEMAPIAGGWGDDAVWAAAGLPTTGETLLQLHVHSVG